MILWLNKNIPCKRGTKINFFARESIEAHSVRNASRYPLLDSHCL